MNEKTLFFGLIIIAVALEVMADVLFKKWSVENRSAIFVLGMAVYTIGTFFWAVSLRKEYLSKAISVFTVLNLVVVALVGALYFKEELSMLNKAGIVLGVISVILVEL